MIDKMKFGLLVLLGSSILGGQSIAMHDAGDGKGDRKGDPQSSQVTVRASGTGVASSTHEPETTAAKTPTSYKPVMNEISMDKNASGKIVFSPLNGQGDCEASFDCNRFLDVKEFVTEYDVDIEGDDFFLFILKDDLYYPQKNGQLFIKFEKSIRNHKGTLEIIPPHLGKPKAGEELTLVIANAMSQLDSAKKDADSLLTPKLTINSLRNEWDGSPLAEARAASRRALRFELDMMASAGRFRLLKEKRDLQIMAARAQRMSALGNVSTIPSSTGSSAPVGAGIGAGSGSSGTIAKAPAPQQVGAASAGAAVCSPKAGISTGLSSQYEVISLEEARRNGRVMSLEKAREHGKDVEKAWQIAIANIPEVTLIPILQAGAGVGSQSSTASVSSSRGDSKEDNKESKRS